MAKKTQNAVYLVAADGRLTVKNFEPRTFGDALEGSLKKGWKKEPKKLAKAVASNPDLLTAAVGLMGAAQDILAKELDKLSDKINGIYETAIADNDRDFTDEEIKLLDKLEPNADQLSEDLEDMATMPPSDWLLLSSKKSYKIVVKVFEEFFKLPVVDGWECFSAALDTPEGLAAHELRSLGLAAADDFELEFNYGADIAPESVTTKMTLEELSVAASQGGYPITFVEDVIPQRAADIEEEKTPTKKPAAKKAPAQKAAAKKTAAKKTAPKAEPKAEAAPKAAKATKASAKETVAKPVKAERIEKAVPAEKPAAKKTSAKKAATPKAETPAEVKAETPAVPAPVVKA